MQILDRGTGECVRCFGGEGSDKGLFNGPSGNFYIMRVIALKIYLIPTTVIVGIIIFHFYEKN